MSKKPLAVAKKFVSTHKTKIAVVATAAVCFAIHRSAVNEWNGFLDAKGLTEEYYHIEG